MKTLKGAFASAVGSTKPVISAVSTIATSGLEVARRRLQQSANNVANLNSDGYEAQRVIPHEVKPAGVDSTTQPTGAPHPVMSDGAVDRVLSNTDLISETTERLGAGHAFKANLATIRAQDEMTKSLLDIKA